MIMTTSQLIARRENMKNKISSEQNAIISINKELLAELENIFEITEHSKKKASVEEIGKLLSKIFVQNIIHKYSGGTNSKPLIEAQNKTLSDWTTEINSKEKCLSKLIRESNLFDKFVLRGDITLVEAEHIKYLDNLSDMPNLEDIYVFVSENNKVECWLVVNQLSYEERLDYIEKEDDFCETNSIENYNVLIIEKKQLRVDKMPSPSYSFHKKEGCGESAR